MKKKYILIGACTFTISASIAVQGISVQAAETDQETGTETAVVDNLVESRVTTDQNKVTKDTEKSTTVESISTSQEETLTDEKVLTDSEAESISPTTTPEETTQELNLNEVEEETEINGSSDVEVNTSLRAKSRSAQTGEASETVTRVSGLNRYTNAVEMSESAWNQSNAVIVTNGETWADALTGSPLASKYDAPLLFVKKGNVPDETLVEIQRLRAQNVVILGSEASVSAEVMQTFKAAGLNTRRIDGANRYTLATNIASELKAEQIQQNQKYEAFLASGEVFSDAMSISAVASERQIPIYLTRKNKLDQSFVDALPFINKITILGGEATISDEIAQFIQTKGIRVTRIGGENRYAVNRNVLATYSPTATRYIVASGDHPSDGMPAGVLAAKQNQSLLLVKNNNITTIMEQQGYADTNGGCYYTFVGGEATLSNDTLAAFENMDQWKAQQLGEGTLVNNVIYAVESGDSLAQIANKFNTSVQAIQLASGLTSMLIVPGQTLIIPTAVAKPMDLPQSYDNRSVILLDPGHGGIDPGAVYNGVNEHELNWNLALKLAAQLHQLGFEVLFTRGNNESVELDERSLLANASNADIFISLHHNAGSKSVNGIETYYYEYTTGYEPSINAAYHNDAQRLTNSKYLGQLIQNNLISRTGAFDRGLQTATFAVLRETKIPAVLVEYGFGTNARELTNLTTASYQTKLTQAVADAVQTYLKNVH